MRGAGDARHHRRAGASRVLDRDARRRLARSALGADGMPPSPGVRRRRPEPDRRRRPAARDAGAGLRVEEPAVGQRVAVGIAGRAGVEHERRADRARRSRPAPCRRWPFTTTSGLWFASRLSLIVQSMRAAKSCWNAVPPAPDRRLVGCVGPAVHADDGVARVVAARIRIAALRPERPRLAVELPPHVAAAPAAVGRAHRAGEPVVDQAEERRRVPLVDAARHRIELAERSLAGGCSR